MYTKYLMLIIYLLIHENIYSQYRILGIPTGDCNRKELTLVDNNDNPLSIVLTDANEKNRLCSWVNWTASNKKIANQVMILIGLKSTNNEYALLSYGGDCNKRVFRIYNKTTKEIFEKEVLNNCSIIDFNKNPAEIAAQLCKEFNCN